MDPFEIAKFFREQWNSKGCSRAPGTRLLQVKRKLAADFSDATIFYYFQKTQLLNVFFVFFRQLASFAESCPLCFFFCNIQKVYDDFINVQQVSFW